MVLSVPPPGRNLFGGGTFAGCPQAQDANRQIPAAQRRDGISKALPHFRCPSTELQLCCTFLQEAKSHRAQSPPSALYGTPRQPGPLSSMVSVTSFPPFHTEDWKGDGGAVLTSLLHHQHSAAEEEGKAKE